MDSENCQILISVIGTTSSLVILECWSLLQHVRKQACALHKNIPLFMSNSRYIKEWFEKTGANGRDEFYL